MSTQVTYPHDKMLTQERWDKMLADKQAQAIGIPYAFSVGVNRVLCPVCGAVIQQKARKDFESFTGSEYQRHYAEHHQNPTRERRVKWRPPVQSSEGQTYASACGRYSILKYVTSDRIAFEIKFRGVKPTHCDSLREAQNDAEIDNNPNWMP